MDRIDDPQLATMRLLISIVYKKAPKLLNLSANLMFKKYQNTILRS